MEGVAYASTMEERFLRSRQLREEERVQQRGGPSDVVQARQQALADIRSLTEDAKELIQRCELEGAQAKFTELQRRIQLASEAECLPPHEMRSANNALAELLSSLEALRSGMRPTKKFAFTSKRNDSGAVGAVVGKTPTAPPLSSVSASTEERESLDNVYAGLSDQVVFVRSSKAVYLRECTRCTFLVLPIDGSCFVTACNDCTIYAACHQMRVKSCHRTHMYVWCSSTPIIESSDEMCFGSYAAWVGLVNSHVAASLCGLDDASVDATAHFSTHEEWVANVGKIKNIDHAVVSFKKIDDFQWLRQSQSPNWRALSPEEYKVEEMLFFNAH
jgi:hypothetical protein